ncbi:hypothetical protein V493_03047 [Pseudogymnoascus sp. VKM F-4281 (FW-2241)]|nr:hypothetical protein V493_03047 [Pseudogymnoascus sp. VKM F-4281 (FW-2241)]
MKIILTGSTGVVGSAVLQQCLQNASITSIVVLSRRPLSANFSSPKLKVIILTDFLTYPEDVLAQLDDAQACIWALGGMVSKYPNVEMAREVIIEYPLAAAAAIIVRLRTQKSTGGKFRFVSVSGMAAVRDMNKKLWIFKDSRQIKGELENGMIDLAERNPDSFEVFLARVGSVIPKDNFTLSIIGPLTSGIQPIIRDDELAIAMVDIALNGAKTEFVSHEELVTRGRMSAKDNILLDNPAAAAYYFVRKINQPVLELALAWVSVPIKDAAAAAAAAAAFRRLLVMLEDSYLDIMTIGLILARTSPHSYSLSPSTLLEMTQRMKQS